MLTEEIQQITNQYVMNTYDRLPLSIVRGQGSQVYDAEGRAYLDCVGGIAVNSLGYGHPDLINSLERQIRRLLHTSNLFYTEPQAQLARRLVNHSFAEKVFFANSGAEANEAAIKLARKYSHDHFGPERSEIVTMVNSFHGRTLATLSATGQTKVQQGFWPLLEGFTSIPFNDLSALEAAISERTAAVMLEPVLGEGGVVVAEAEYLKAVRELCTSRNILLIFDEIQTGIGRTGSLFAYEHFDIQPDIMTLAKGLGGGLPIGACLATQDVSQAFSHGTHGSTFGGNPLACSAALQVLNILLEGGELNRCRERGEYLHNGLRALMDQFPVINEVRGLGLLQGIELSIEGKPIVMDCLARRVIINCTMGRVLRFVPPLVITQSEIDSLLSTLSDVLAKYS
ncbi:MAG: acetylornithine transaminase [Nitrospirales bacterium]|nr:acetylornithine transaminase [Nitrospira sp.]MDR4500792.1 acetylornithine transaminase [Nitrospirales bacterium]